MCPDMEQEVGQCLQVHTCRPGNDKNGERELLLLLSLFVIDQLVKYDSDLAVTPSAVHTAHKKTKFSCLGNTINIQQCRY